jgi:hypothetical protein
MSFDNELYKYGLRFHKFAQLDVKKCYMQSRPNSEFMDDVLGEVRDPKGRFSMLNSPHAEFATLYFKHGKKWLKNNYNKTRYKIMQLKYKKKNNFPDGFLRLCESLKMGYLRRKFDQNFIVVLDEPFAKSRFNRDVPSLSPEVWSGHHRIGIILALNKINNLDSKVKVAIAVDGHPGSLKSAGKIHKLCIAGSGE